MTWTQQESLHNTDQGVHGLAWSPDGAYLAIGANTDGVKVYETTNWTVAFNTTFTSDAGYVAWHPTDGILSVCSDNDSVEHYEAGTWTHLDSHVINQDEFTQMGWSPDGQYFYGEDGGTARAWSVDTSTWNRTLEYTDDLGADVRGLTWHPDGYFVIGDFSAGVRLVEAGTWTVLDTHTTTGFTDIWRLSAYSSGNLYVGLGQRNSNAGAILDISNNTITVENTFATDSQFVTPDPTDTWLALAGYGTASEVVEPFSPFAAVSTLNTVSQCEAAQFAPDSNWFAQADSGAATNELQVYDTPGVGADISGTVTDDQATAVSGVTVYLYDEETDTFVDETTTDANGDYLFSQVDTQAQVVVEYEDGSQVQHQASNAPFLNEP